MSSINPVGPSIYHQNQVNVAVQSDVSQVNPVSNAIEEFVFEILKSLAANKSVSDILPSLAINPTRLRCAPRTLSMEMMANAVTSANPPVNIEELLTQCDRVKLAYQETVNSGIGEYLLPELKNIILDYTTDRDKKTYIQNALVSLRKNQYDQFNPLQAILKRELRLFLKNIILELRNENISPQDREDILYRIGYQFSFRLKGSHVGVRLVCQQLVFKKETVEDILLQCLQQIKVNLINNYSFNLDQWEVVNSIQSVVGEELGLDLMSIEKDRFLPLNMTQEQKREKFLEAFNLITPNDILVKLKQQLDLRLEKKEIMTLFREYIDNKIKEIVALSNGRISDKFTTNLPAPFQDSFDELTDKGVLFLLVHFGILNQPKQDNNLIQATTPTIPATIADNNLSAKGR